MVDWDAIWVDVNLATMSDEFVSAENKYGEITDAALAIKDGLITWVGARADLPSFDALSIPVHSCQGAWITPGLIDCHTHLVFGGNRAHEFEQRLNGVSYEEIAKQGGGIISTVKATREASHELLYTGAAKRLNALLKEGVSTVEIKSGYGLDTDNEIKMLEVARLLGEHHKIDVKTTFLGAHALPPEFKDNADGYIDLICEQMLPAVAKENLADAVDAFCEGIGFSIEQTKRVFDAAVKLDLPVKLHAEQLSDLGGAALVANYNGLSADHLEYLSESSINAMAEHNTTAVLLPGAFYALRETKLPPIDKLRERGVNIAIATDCNPGSSPLCSLQLMLHMACTLFKMTPSEALHGVTRNAAKALGLDDRGILAVGTKADFVVWDIQQPAELAYQYGCNPLKQFVIDGEIITH